ncbi:MAG: regulatory protein TetR [Verrucomicrobiaceae bacterium]|nr:regulatory protein TetR [Verrucomicrobiaceae bacterium]
MTQKVLKQKAAPQKSASSKQLSSPTKFETQRGATISTADASIPTTTERGRPTLDDSKAKLEKLYKIAFHHFMLNGLEGANLQTIARDAGVSRQMIHNRFGNKQQLFEAVVVGGEIRFFEEIDFDPAVKSQNPWLIFEHIGNRIYDFNLSPDYIESMQIMNTAFHRFPEIAKVNAQIIDDAHARIANYLTETAAEAGIVIAQPADASRDFVALIFGLVYPVIHKMSARPTTRAQHKRIKELVARFLRGVGFADPK